MKRIIEEKKDFFARLAPRWEKENVVAERLSRDLSFWLSPLKLKAGDRILDLGGGTGRLARFLSSVYRIRSICLDFASGMVKEGRRRNYDPRINFIQADAHDLPLADGSVDHIISFCSFPHFDHKEGVIGECYRVLQKEGTLTVIHDSGRDEINTFHSRQEQTISNDHLPPPDQFRYWAVNGGWETEEISDFRKRFLVRFRKPTNQGKKSNR